MRALLTGVIGGALAGLLVFGGVQTYQTTSADSTSSDSVVVEYADQ
jgi:hypothetical protein